MSPQPKVGPPLLGALMRMPVDAVHARIVAGVHAAGFTDIVPAHMAVMRYPGPDGRRPSDLADEAGVTRQAMNYLLGQLEELGYLVREDDGDDRRSRRVQLTKRGARLATAMRRVVAGIEAEVARELGARDARELRRLLVKLNATSLVSGTSAARQRSGARAVTA